MNAASGTLRFLMFSALHKHSSPQELKYRTVIGQLSDMMSKVSDNLLVSKSIPSAKALREHEEVSQTVFVLYMNVSKDSVSQWERGIKKPGGPTLKLLSLIKQKGLAAIL